MVNISKDINEECKGYLLMKRMQVECDYCGFVGVVIPDESVNGDYGIEYCPSCGSDHDINIDEIIEVIV